MDRKRDVVIDMDENRRAEWAETRAKAEILRVAPEARAEILPRSEIVTLSRTVPRSHSRDEDDYPDDPLVKWKRGMIRAGVWPAKTAEEREREVREALAKYQLQVFVDGRLDAKLAVHTRKMTDTLAEQKLLADARRDAMADFVAQVRKQLRAEIAEAHMPNRPAGEFFYLDDNGVKQDSELHNPILRAVDYPIDEKIMGPIRARHRAKWLAGQRAKGAARIIDLPALPLRSSRRA
jgi:hypothetical protein